MRFIDLTLIALPNGWEQRAQDATDAVMVNGDDVNDHSDVWRDFKPSLETIVGKKCWYCESKQSRSDKEVEHFRPKKRVTGVTPPHSGYKWLTFDYRNLRYSCAFCNKRRRDKERACTSFEISFLS